MILYVDRVAKRIGEESGLDFDNSAEGDLLRLYALLALSKGHETAPRDVHDAWACWAADRNPTHPSLVPYEELDAETQALDDDYVEAIHLVASELVPAPCAIEPLRAAGRWSTWRCGAHRIDFTVDGQAEPNACRVAVAILGEREACAALAGRWARDYRSDGEDRWAEAAEMVRDAIRARTPGVEMP